MNGLLWYGCLFVVIVGVMKKEYWLLGLGLLGMWYF